MSIGSALVSGYSQYKSAKSAEKINQQTLAQQKAMYDDLSGKAQTYIDTGNSALTKLNNPGENFTVSPGYNFRLNQGTQTVLGNNATKGLLSSGAAVKALNNYAQGQASSEYNNWWNQQSGLAGMGLQGINALSGAQGAFSENLSNASKSSATNASTANSAVGGALQTLLGSKAVQDGAKSFISSFGR